MKRWAHHRIALCVALAAGTGVLSAIFVPSTWFDDALWVLALIAAAVFVSIQVWVVLGPSGARRGDG